MPITWDLPRTPRDRVVDAPANSSPPGSDQLFREMGLGLADRPIGLDGRFRSPVSASPTTVLPPKTSPAGALSEGSRFARSGRMCAGRERYGRLPNRIRCARPSPCLGDYPAVEHRGLPSR